MLRDKSNDKNIQNLEIDILSSDCENECSDENKTIND